MFIARVILPVFYEVFSNLLPESYPVARPHLTSPPGASEAVDCATVHPSPGNRPV